MFSLASDFKTLDGFVELNERYRGISSFFGAAHDLGLDGGREFFRTTEINSLELVRFVNNCNTNGMGFFHVFNTSLIDETDLKNEKLNGLLAATQNKINGVICANHKLRDYVADNYPEFKLIASRIFNKVDDEGIKELCRKYDLVVLPEQKNNDFELLKRLPAEKIELIVNSFCRWHCKNREKHYRLISKYNKKMKNPSSFKRNFYKHFILSRITCPKSSKEEIERVRIELNQIKKYLDMGFKNFKVLDRSNPPTPLFVEEYLREVNLFKSDGNI